MLFFEVKTKRLTVNDSNRYHRVREARLFQAESYTEAEALVTAFMEEAYPKEEFQITKITQSKFTDVIAAVCADKYWKAKVTAWETNDSGKETKASYYMLVDAKDSTEANERVLESISGWVTQAEINKIEETKLVDFVPKEEENDDGTTSKKK